MELDLICKLLKLLQIDRKGLSFSDFGRMSFLKDWIKVLKLKVFTACVGR